MCNLVNVQMADAWDLHIMVDVQMLSLIITYLLFIVCYDICCTCTMLWHTLQFCSLPEIILFYSRCVMPHLQHSINCQKSFFSALFSRVIHNFQGHSAKFWELAFLAEFLVILSVRFHHSCLPELGIPILVILLIGPDQIPNVLMSGNWESDFGNTPDWESDFGDIPNQESDFGDTSNQFW